jgi:hypothetical protein
MRRIFPQLLDTVCPWAFSVVLEGRRQYRLDYRLREQGVSLFTFGDVLHPRVLSSGHSDMLRKARFLADNLVCLSIDQNLTREEISRACDTVNAFIRAL